MYEATLVKSNTLRREGYTVVEMWECEWQALLKDVTSPEHQFAQSLELPNPLNPREALFGGRTGATTLYAHADEAKGETIRYLDVTSLYPWVNKTAIYPVGHPEIITNPTHLDIGRYFGIALVDILPPPGLFHPVLPVHSGGKLTFSLCAACVREEQAKPFLDRRSSCSHSDAKRTLRGTWCTPEIQQAISKGYTLVRIHEVWHFPLSNRKRVSLPGMSIPGLNSSKSRQGGRGGVQMRGKNKSISIGTNSGRVLIWTPCTLVKTLGGKRWPSSC